MGKAGKLEVNNTVTRRQDGSASVRMQTGFWYEEPADNNPYLNKRAYCYGYDLQELMQHYSYTEVLFLIMRGELPTPEQTGLLTQLQIAFINPGIRHAATRAAINASVGRTDPAHYLPIGLSILSGSHLGAAEIYNSMRFFQARLGQDIQTVLQEFEIQIIEASRENTDTHPIPGFGRHFGDIDPFIQRIARQLAVLSEQNRYLDWGAQLSEALAGYQMGWLATGLVAAGMCDLNFTPRQGIGMYQLLCAPGIFAHADEYAQLPLEAFPFVGDDKYQIEVE